LTCSDFSHSLFNWYRQKKIKRDLRFYFQKKMYSRFYGRPKYIVKRILKVKSFEELFRKAVLGFKLLKQVCFG